MITVDLTTDAGNHLRRKLHQDAKIMESPSMSIKGSSTATATKQMILLEHVISSMLDDAEQLVVEDENGGARTKATTTVSATTSLLLSNAIEEARLVDASNPNDDEASISDPFAVPVADEGNEATSTAAGSSSSQQQPGSSAIALHDSSLNSSMDSILSCDSTVNDNAPRMPRRFGSPTLKSPTNTATGRRKAPLLPPTTMSPKASPRHRKQQQRRALSLDSPTTSEASIARQTISTDLLPPRITSSSVVGTSSRRRGSNSSLTIPRRRRGSNSSFDRFAAAAAASSSGSPTTTPRKVATIVDRFAPSTAAATGATTSASRLGGGIPKTSNHSLDRFSSDGSMSLQLSSKDTSNHSIDRFSAPKMPRRGPSIAVQQEQQQGDSSAAAAVSKSNDIQRFADTEFGTSDFDESSDEDDSNSLGEFQNDDDDFNTNPNDSKGLRKQYAQQPRQISDITNPSIFHDSDLISIDSDIMNDNDETNESSSPVQEESIPTLPTKSSTRETIGDSSSIASPEAAVTKSSPQPQTQVEAIEQIAEINSQHGGSFVLVDQVETKLLDETPSVTDAPTKTNDDQVVPKKDTSAIPEVAAATASSVAISTPQVPYLPSKLSKLADRFKRGMKVGNHKYHFKTYENCFVGKDAVDFMLANGMAASREDAVFLGQRFITELHLFHHVCWDHTFKDSYLFFRFSTEALPAPLGDSNSSLVHVDGEDKEALAMSWNSHSNSNSNSNSSNGLSQGATTVVTTPLPTDDLKALGRKFKKNITVSTHIYHFKRYQKTFVGKEAVDYMVKSKMAASREDAVFLGQRLLDELNLFNHVCFDHTFKDAYLFYRYNEEYKEEDGPRSPVATAGQVHGTDTHSKKRVTISEQATLVSPIQSFNDISWGDDSPRMPKRGGSVILGTLPLNDNDNGRQASFARIDFSGDVSCSTGTSNGRRTLVEFDCVHVRMYERILDVHPSTSSGPSVGLGWEYTQLPPVLIDDEGTWMTSTASSSRDFILSRQVRETMVKELGYSSRQVSKAVRTNKKICDQRRETLNNLTAKTMKDRSKNQDKNNSSPSRRSRRVGRLFRGRRR